MADLLVLSLDEIRATDAAIAGGKGANLGELIAAGFPVPNGFILTTPAYGLAARSASVDPSDPDVRRGSTPRRRRAPGGGDRSPRCVPVDG